MSDNIIDFPKPEIPNIVGAEVRYNKVFVDGHVIPRMGCRENEDNIEIILDGRWCYIFPKEIAYLAADLAANAMAIGAGYSHLGAESKSHPFAPKIMMLDNLPKE